MPLNFLTTEVREHPAWALIGHTRKEGWRGQDAVSDAFRDARMDYELQMGIPSLALADGTTIPYNVGNRADKNIVIVRPAIPGLDAQPRPLGMVSRKYFEEGLIQPMRLARILDPLAVRWNVTAVGALDHGRKSFVALELGERSIEIFGPKGKSATDQFKGFIFVVEDHSGGGSVKFFYGDMQWHCKNQLISISALIQGNRSVRQAGLLTIPHHGITADLLELRAKVEVAAEDARQREDARLRSFAAYALSEPEIDYILRETYPDANDKTVARVYDHVMSTTNAGEVLRADDPTLIRVQLERDEANAEKEKMQKRRENKRDEAREAFRFYDELHPEWAGSAYNFLSGMVELADYGGNISDGVRQSVLIGDRAKVKVRAAIAISDVVGFK